MYDYEIKQSPGGLRIRIDPELATELVLILGSILDMARVIRGKAKAVRAARRAADPEDLARRAEAFDKRSLEIFVRYQEHVDAGSTAKEALQEVRQEFNIGYGDAKDYLSQGRTLSKPKRPKPDRQLTEKASEEAA